MIALLTLAPALALLGSDALAAPHAPLSCEATARSFVPPDDAPCTDGVAAWLDSSGDGYATVAEALADAVHDDVVTVCPGTWTEELTVTRSLTLRGYGASVSVLSGGGSQGVLTVSAAADSFTLEGLGVEDGVSMREDDAAGAWIKAATVSIFAARFEGNDAEHNGGALSLDSTVETADISETCFLENSAGYAGGAIDADATTDLTITDSLFEGNVSDYEGGAIDYGGRSANDGMRIRGSVFFDNYASYSGGALELGSWDDARIEIFDSWFGFNESAYQGGAINTGSWDGNTLWVVATMFLDNSSKYGGAIELGGWGKPVVTLFDCLVQRNTASTEGGAFALSNRGKSTLNVYRSTILQNKCTACSEGGASLDSDAKIKSIDTDWGRDTLDNTPYDVESYTFDGVSSFTCATSTCS